MAGIMQLAASIIAASGPPAPPPPASGNLGSITVASQPYSDGIDSGTSYGAASGAVDSSRFPAFGTVTGGTQILVNVDVGSGFTQLNIADGSYTGFTVTNGAVDGDVSSAQYFTVDGTTSSFTVESTGVGTYKYIATGDPFGLTAKFGQTLGVDLVLPGVFLFGDITVGYDGSVYGWNQYGGPGSSTITYPPDASNGIYYNSFGSYTRIELQPGTYYGVDVNGSTFTVDGGNTITANIGGVSSVLTVGSMLRADVAGDPFSLQSKNGQTLAVSVAAGGSPTPPGPGGAFAAGNITVAQGGFTNSDYGWDYVFGYGSSTIPTPPSGPTIRIFYSPDPPGPSSTPSTIIGFQSGTYGNTVVVNSPTATIDDETQVTVTIDGVTQVGTLETTGSGPQLVFSGDVFSLQSKNTQTLAVSMVAGIVVPPSNEVASGDITVGTDTFGPPGTLYGYFPPAFAGSSTISPAMVAQLYWYSGGVGPSGSTTIKLTGGTYGNVVVDANAGTVDGETQLTVVVDSISQTGTLMPNGSNLDVLISGDPYSLQSKNGQTLAVSVIAGTGGGGGTTYTSSGNWSSSSLDNFGFWRVALILDFGVNSAFLSSLNALTAGSTFSVTDSGNTTVSLTVQSTMGQPWSPGISVTINVNTPPPGTSSMPSIASITI